MIIAYHGLGYVGLTGAVHFAQAEGITEVIGYDPDQHVVEAINSGTPKAGEFLAYLENKQYRPTLWATTDFSDTLTADVHILAVPSERDDRPYMAIVEDVVKRLVAAVPVGTTIIIESTLTPGTVALLEAQIGVLVEDKSLLIAVAPRRDWFADPTKNLANVERIVGGINDQSTARAIEVLSKVTDPSKILTTGFQEAELVKATENALLHLPLMLLHELACRYPHVDTAAVARLASTHWRFQSMGQLYFGLGTGGRCVPLGPHYLNEGATNYFFSSTVIGAALNVERAMSEIGAQAILRQMDALRGPDVPFTTAILGIAYRPQFKDAGMSPGLRLANRLAAQQIAPKRGERTVVAIDDPMWSFEELEKFGHLVGSLAPRVDYDCVVLMTPHAVYRDAPETLEWRGEQLIVDAYGVWEKYQSRFEAQGSVYVRVGSPRWLLK